MGLENKALVRITDVQDYLGQQVLNVYYYRYVVVLPAEDEVYEEIANDFKDNLLSAVATLQVNYLTHREIRVENLSNGVDLYSKSIAVYGSITATDITVMPSNITAGYIMRRGNRVTRNGYKRYSGLHESQVSGNNYVPGNDLAVSNIEEKLADAIYLGAVPALFPVIMKRPFDTPVQYDYFYSPVTSAALVGLGTQNSRKAGRGT